MLAEIAISANDNHLVQLDGVNTVVASPRPDSLTVIDLGAAVPTVVATVAEVLPDTPVTIGGPIPNYTCYVCDDATNLLRRRTAMV